MSEKPSIEYARRLYDDVRRWYDSADTKAQVILALDGAFLTFLTSAIFGATELTGSFATLTWLLLAAMTVCLVVSMASAIYCLWPRIYSNAGLGEFVETAEREKGRSGLAAPETMWFFQMIAGLEKKPFRTTLESVDESFEMKAMASQIWILSGHVHKKHLAVNVGFVLAATTLILFLLAGLSHLCRLA